MTTKTLLRLLLLLAVASALAYWLNRPAGNVTVDGVTAGDPVLPGLDVNAITRIEVAGSLSTAIIVRADNGWVSEHWFGYPARFDRVVSALRSLADLKVGQVQRDGATLLADYGLDTAMPGTDTLHIRLGTRDKPDAFALMLGSLKHPRDAASIGLGMPNGRFVRAAGGPVVLVEDVLTGLGDTPGAWVERTLVSIKAEEIESINVIGKSDEFSLRRNEEGSFVLGGLADDQAVDQAAVLRMLQPLQILMADAVRDPALSASEQGIADHEVLLVRLRNELNYQFTIGAPGESFDAPRAMKIAVSWQPENRGGGADESAAAREAETGMARLGGWVFSVPGAVAAQLVTTRDALVVTHPVSAPASGENSP
ncbi:MAG TPA: DUF4340 domain-containing protein [Kiritimatiellia bacterium]|nr:DUF4340 domain-containing protein [Kiritimatiellia bacterium]HMP34572.1 DUF4340 domain-containing protein [Kiritimatiellia bacterium]